MDRYIVLYRAPESAAKQMENATPEDMQKGMEPWMAWASRCGDGLVDIGSPLGDGRHVTTSGNTPSDSDVVGYSVLQAETTEAALALLEGHPHIEWAEGCEIELHKAMPLPV